jgi:hypothetical protein
MASEVRLFEHADFEQAIIRAAQHFEVNEQFVEKDYYVTEVLRIVAHRLGDAAMFKGGTSLSKGWRLISRFSEDIDLFVKLDGAGSKPTNNHVDRELKALATAVAGHRALTWLKDEGQTIGGGGRDDHFAYASNFDELPGIRPVVRLESGIQSGTFPTEVVPITSLVGQYLQEQGAGGTADDLIGFDMTLLHFRRTFVEKLFAIHGKVIRLVDEGVPLGRDARHYADLYELASRPEVRAMLGSREYGDIREDYDQKSRKYFAGSYRPPENLSFAQSPALFPDADLRARLAVDYETQCQLLFAGSYPSFDEVCARFAEIRQVL